MNKRFLITFGVITLIAIGTVLAKSEKSKTANASIEGKYSIEPYSAPKSATSSSVQNTFATNSQATVKPPSPAKFLGEDLLNEKDLERFQPALDQIQRFTMWGKFDANKTDELKTLLLEFGPRAVATFTYELDNMDKSLIASKDDAGAVIKKIDFLSVLSDHKMPLAEIAIERLATKGVEWNEQGDFVDGVKAGITFECFDMLSKHEPQKALDHIKSFDKRYQMAYIDHYIIGRRLANTKDEDITNEIKDNFGLAVNL